MIYTQEQSVKAISGEASLGTLYKLFRTIIDEPEEDDDINELLEAKEKVDNGINIKFDIFYLLNNRVKLVKNKYIEIDYIGKWEIREYEEEKAKRESLMRRIIAEHTDDNKTTTKR